MSQGQSSSLSGVSAADHWSQQRVLVPSLGNPSRSDHQVVRQGLAIFVECRRFLDVELAAHKDSLAKVDVSAEARAQLESSFAAAEAQAKFIADRARTASIAFRLVLDHGFASAANFGGASGVGEVLSAEETKLYEQSVKCSERSGNKSAGGERLRMSKANSYCRVCGQRGHWWRDAECPKSASRTRSRSPRGRSPAAAPAPQ